MVQVIEGDVAALPKTVHVEQDGELFFVVAEKTPLGDTNFQPTLAVIDSETRVGFDEASGRAAQDVIRALLVEHGITATFDY